MNREESYKPSSKAAAASIEDTKEEEMNDKEPSSPATTTSSLNLSSSRVGLNQSNNNKESTENNKVPHQVTSRLDEQDEQRSRTTATYSRSQTKQTSSSIFFRQRVSALTQFFEKINIPPAVFMVLTVLIPIAALITFAMLYVFDEREIVDRMSWVEESLPAIDPLLDMLHACQHERILTVLYLTRNHTQSFLESDLYPARNETNHRHHKLTTALNLLPSDITDRQYRVNIEHGFQEIDVARILLSQKQDNVLNIFTLYSDLNVYLAEGIGAIAAECPDAAVATRLYRLLLVAITDEFIAEVRDYFTINLSGPLVTNITASKSNLVESDLLGLKAFQHAKETERAYRAIVPNEHEDDYKTYVLGLSEYTFLHESVSALEGGLHKVEKNRNYTKWIQTGETLLNGFRALERVIFSENQADVENAQVAAENATIAIAAAIALALLPAALVIFVSTQSYRELQAEKAASKHLEGTIMKLIPMELLVHLGVDVRSIAEQTGGQQQQQQPPDTKGMVVTLISLQFWNNARVAQIDGDEALFRAIDAMYTAAVEIMEEANGHILEFSSEGMLMIVPEPLLAIAAASRLQMTLLHINIQRIGKGSDIVAWDATICAHHTIVVVGLIGNLDRVQCSVISGSVAFTKRTSNQSAACY
eukprot:PhM_4_TR745/c0_g1_i1/m.43289